MSKKKLQFKNEIDLAISHILEKGCDDIFRPPVFSESLEHGVILRDPDAFRQKAAKAAHEFLAAKDLKNVRIGQVQRTLFVRDYHTFRHVAWLDPFDAVKFLALAIILFEQIEAARIPKERQKVHSHRRSEDGTTIFDKEFGYRSFRELAGQKTRENIGGWKIVTDISNFFDRISNHALENHLREIGCDEKLTSLLRDMLLFWSGGDRRSYGLPVGSDASRIVSEAALLNVDRALSDGKIDFIRYVDDFRVFSPTREEAYRTLQLLTDLLAEEGLSLNSGKTKVYQIKEEADLEEETAFQLQEHETIDLSKKKTVTQTIRVSGRTAYSKRYVVPGEEAVRNLKALNKSNTISKYLATEGGEEESLLRLLIKYYCYVDQDVDILRIILNRRITSVFYISDALIKEGGRFSEESKKVAKDLVLREYNWGESAYPFQIPLLRLSASEHFLDTEFPRRLFDLHRVMDNPIFYRELITLSFDQLDRFRIRNLAKSVFYNSPDFVQRAIYQAVKNCSFMQDDEKRPLLLNMRTGAADWFVKKLAE